MVSSLIEGAAVADGVPLAPLTTLRIGPVARWVGGSRFVVTRELTGHEMATWVAAVERLTADLRGGTWRLTVPQGWCTVACFVTWAERQVGPIVRAVSAQPAGR